VYTFGLYPPVYVVKDEHNHPARPSQIEVKQAISELKSSQASNSNLHKPRRLILEAQKQLSKEAIALMPSYEALRQRLQRCKVNPYGELTMPSSIKEIDLPDEFQYTMRGDLFLQFDSGQEDPERYLIFTTNDNLEYLNTNSSWYIDGTFDSCPDLFYQMLTIHVLAKGRNLPCIYTLLPSKKQSAYKSVFEWVSSRIENIPTSATCDFELALINALVETFDDIEIFGCFFHFRQSLWRHIQSAKFVTDYNNDEKVRSFFRKIASLAFVPVSDVIDAFVLLKKSLSDMFAKYNVFTKYFEENYIGSKKRGKSSGRHQPRFAIEYWNVYSRNIQGLPRSNNNIEGWHNAFQQTIGKHPHIYKFVDCIKLEQSNTENLITELGTGKTIKRLHNRYVAFNNRLDNIVSVYKKDNLLNYLENISLVIEY